MKYNGSLRSLENEELLASFEQKGGVVTMAGVELLNERGRITDVRTDGEGLYLKMEINHKFESTVKYFYISPKKYQHVKDRFNLNKVVIEAGEFAEKEKALDLARSLNKKCNIEEYHKYRQEVWAKYNRVSDKKSYVVVATHSKDLLKDDDSYAPSMLKRYLEHEFSVRSSEGYAYKLKIASKK